MRVICSPYLSRTMFITLSSSRVGASVLHSASSAYMRSAVLLIYTTSVTVERVQFYTYLVILITPRVILSRPHDPIETPRKHPCRIRHSSEHQVTQASMVCCADVCRSGCRERCFLTHTQPQPHLFYDLERERKVTEEDVDAEESNQREIPELAIQRPRAILARDVPVWHINRVLLTELGWWTYSSSSSVLPSVRALSHSLTWLFWMRE